MTTYAILTSTAASFAARNDLSAQMATFVTLAEDRIRRDVRVLNQQVAVTLTVDNTGAAPLPDRFLGFRSVSLAVDASGLSRTAQLDYLAPDFFREKRLDSQIFTGSTRDSFYTIEGDNILLMPVPEGTSTTDILATYWRAYDRLDETTNTTNWLLQNHFDIYFNGVMVHVNSFLMDTNAELLWVGKYQQAVESLGRHEGRKQRSGPFIRMARSAP